MPIEETLRRSLDALARDLASAVEAERADAEAAVRTAAERDLAAAVQAAEARGRDEGWQVGLDEGRAQGRDEGRRLGLEEGLKEGRVQGVEDGRQQGIADGRREGFDDGRREGYAAGLEEGRKQGLREGRDQGIEEGRAAHAADEAAARSANLATSERLADALRALDRARSLSEVLDTLAGCAGREAARAAVLLVQGAQLRGWRFIGFGASLDGTSSYELPLDRSGIIAAAVEQGVVASAESGADGAPPAFASLPAGRELIAVPVALGGKVVAVLYGDQGEGTREARFAWRATLEAIARYAARSLEAITAIRTVQMVAQSPTRRVSNSPSEPDEQTARRYAKLLVSEIKLYHEPDVIAGRRDRDLAVRLGGEIARARVLYEQRVPRDVRGSTDFFHDELVRTLAEGDESLLEVKS